jgi:hypothetical protein
VALSAREDRVPAVSAPLEPYVRARDRGMSDEVRELSTRVIDPRAASLGFLLVAGVGAFVLWWLAESLWREADHETAATRALRQLADPEPTLPAGHRVRPIVILLLDGLRVDEAARLPAMRAFREGARTGSLLFPNPTLSTGAYHALVTGAPNRLTGVFTNRYHRTSDAGVARVDTLGDRVRALHGRERYLGEDLDWLLQLLTPSLAAREVLATRDFDATVRRAMAELAATAEPGLLVAHLLAVDESAHAGGVTSAAHREALRRADALIAELHRQTREQPGLVALVLADHGHLAVGGHGGDEPEVMRAPFALRADGLAPGHIEDLPPECVPRLLTLASGLPTPRSSTCVLFDAPAPERLLERAAFAEDAARQQRLYHEARTLGVLGLAMLLALMGLGATKRSFTGLDAGSLLAPLVWLAGVVLGHRLLLQKPFTLSALDVVTPHLVSVGVLGVSSGALGIALGALRATRNGRPPTPPRLALRRASGALVWASIAAFALAWARIGGSYSPWPLTAFAAYAPVFLAAAGIGALIVAALVLLGTVAKREDPYYERPTADGGPSTGSGDIT